MPARDATQGFSQDYVQVINFGQVISLFEIENSKNIFAICLLCLVKSKSFEQNYILWMCVCI